MAQGRYGQPQAAYSTTGSEQEEFIVPLAFTQHLPCARHRFKSFTVWTYSVPTIKTIRYHHSHSTYEEIETQISKVHRTHMWVVLEEEWVLTLSHSLVDSFPKVANELIWEYRRMVIFYFHHSGSEFIIHNNCLSWCFFLWVSSKKISL